MARVEPRDGDMSGDGGTMSLSDILGAVRRRIRFITGVFVLAIAASVGIALLLPPRFEGVALVQIDPRKRTIVNMEPVTSELRAESAVVDSEIEVIKSGPVMARVIGMLDLRNDQDFSGAPGIVSHLRHLLRMPDAEVPAVDPAQAGGRDEVLASLLQSVKITRVRTSLVIEIRASARTAEKAARLANAIAEAYLADQMDAKVRATARATELIEQRLAGLRQKVSVAERRIADFKAENALFDSEGQLLSEKQLARIMEQTVLARNATAEAKAKLDQLRRLQKRGDGPNATSDVIGNATLRLLKDQLVHATRKEAELATRYGPLHPELIKARAEVAAVRSRISSETSEIVAAVETEYRVASDREQQLAASLALLKEQQVETKQALVRLAELEREASSSKQVFEAFLARYKQTTEAQGLELPDARIVEKASVPLQRAAPKRGLIVAAGLVLGLLGGLGLALLLELLGGGMRRAEDVERDLALAHLASIPAIASGPHDPMREMRMMIAEPNGGFAEAIRGLSYELGIRRLQSGGAVVAVTSTLPNEGREAVASNLALDLALSGQRTLLIDADLRLAGLSRRLAVGGRAGLRDVLSGTAHLESLVLRDSATGLFILPAGAVGGDGRPASHLLASPRLAAIKDELSRRFDVIVVDCPPLLPVLDGRIIAGQADGVVMVAAWQRTPKQLAREAIRNLGPGAEKLAGVVICGVDPQELQRFEGAAGRSDNLDQASPDRLRAA